MKGAMKAPGLFATMVPPLSRALLGKMHAQRLSKVRNQLVTNI
jgi:hypothetical protein